MNIVLYFTVPIYMLLMLTIYFVNMVLYIAYNQSRIGQIAAQPNLRAPCLAEKKNMYLSPRWTTFSFLSVFSKQIIQDPGSWQKGKICVGLLRWTHFMFSLKPTFIIIHLLRLNPPLTCTTYNIIILFDVMYKH